MAFKGLPVRIFKADGGLEIIDYNIGGAAPANNYKGDYKHLPKLQPGEEIDLFFGVRVTRLSDLLDKVQFLINSDDGSLKVMECFGEITNNVSMPRLGENRKGYDNPILGCMDDLASNYNPDAEKDDGTCQYKGCTDPKANNYLEKTWKERNPEKVFTGTVEDDGSCEYELGCMDKASESYDPGATKDDGSCTVAGCTDPLANNHNPDATVDDGSCTFDAKKVEEEEEALPQEKLPNNICGTWKRDGPPIGSSVDDTSLRAGCWQLASDWIGVPGGQHGAPTPRKTCGRSSNSDDDFVKLLSSKTMTGVWKKKYWTAQKRFLPTGGADLIPIKNYPSWGTHVMGGYPYGNGQIKNVQGSAVFSMAVPPGYRMNMWNIGNYGKRGPNFIEDILIREGLLTLGPDGLIQDHWVFQVDGPCVIWSSWRSDNNACMQDNADAVITELDQLGTTDPFYKGWRFFWDSTLTASGGATSGPGYKKSGGNWGNGSLGSHAPMDAWGFPYWNWDRSGGTRGPNGGSLTFTKI